MSHLLIVAGPGTGKTHTLVHSWVAKKSRIPTNATREQIAIYDWCRENLPDVPHTKVCYFAFNKSIQETLEKRIVKGCAAYTFNAFGLQQMRKSWGHINLQSKRTQWLVESMIGQELKDCVDRAHWWAVIKYVEKLKMELLIPSVEVLEFLKVKYSADLSQYPSTEMVANDCLRVLKLCQIPNRQAEFIDQLWLGLQATKKPVYEVGFVDECQDLSPVMFALVKASCKNLVFCGDPNQAIMGFAGADLNMFEKLQGFVDCSLPLKTSFRCPPNIVKLANEVCPSARLTSLPEKEDGAEHQLNERSLVPYLQELPLQDTAILCRFNAPLFSIALKLIKSGIPAYILRNDLDKHLINLIKYSYKKDLASLRTYLLQQIDMNATKKLSQRAQDAFKDKANSILSLLPECKTIDHLYNLIKELYRKPAGPCVTLSTIHKVKGLEWYHVVLCKPVMAPIQYDSETRQFGTDQEINLKFVAVTRTKRNLAWLTLGDS